MKKKALIISIIIILLSIISLIVYYSILNSSTNNHSKQEIDRDILEKSNKSINAIYLENETLYSIDDVIYTNSKNIFESKKLNDQLHLIAEDLKENCPEKSFYVKSFESTSTREWFFVHEFINNVVIDKPRLEVSISEDNSILYMDFYTHPLDSVSSLYLEKYLNSDELSTTLSPKITLEQAQNIVKETLKESSLEDKKLLSQMSSIDPWLWDCVLRFDNDTSTLFWDIRSDNYINFNGSFDINANTGEVISYSIWDRMDI